MSIILRTVRQFRLVTGTPSNFSAFAASLDLPIPSGACRYKTPSLRTYLSRSLLMLSRMAKSGFFGIEADTLVGPLREARECNRGSRSPGSGAPTFLAWAVLYAVPGRCE